MYQIKRMPACIAAVTGSTFTYMQYFMLRKHYDFTAKSNFCVCILPRYPSLPGVTFLNAFSVASLPIVTIVCAPSHIYPLYLLLSTQTIFRFIMINMLEHAFEFHHDHIKSCCTGTSYCFYKSKTDKNINESNFSVQ